MKIAVVGSREGFYYDFIKLKLDPYKEKIDKIISGGAIGVDSYAAKWAKENNIAEEIILPNWKKYGRSAGFIRNKEIVESCDFLICFWNGISKGAKHSYDYSLKIKKPALIIFNSNNKGEIL